MYRCLARTLVFSAFALIAATAQEAVSPNEGPDMMKARREYFFQQRAYPQGFIPSGLRARAVAELNRQLSEQAAQRARARLEGAAAIQTATVGQWGVIWPNPTHHLPLNGMR